MNGTDLFGNQIGETAAEQNVSTFEKFLPSGNEEDIAQEARERLYNFLFSPPLIGGIVITAVCILCFFIYSPRTNQDDYSHRHKTVQDSKIADENKTTLETESENNSAGELVGETSEESSFNPVVSSVVNLFRALQMFLIAFGVVAVCSGIAKIVIWNYDDFERRKGISMIVIGILAQ